MADEVKQGFSYKYILLLILAAAIGGYFQYAFPHFLDSKEMKISYSTRGGVNELSENGIDKDIISVKYSLKNDTSEVKGFYHNFLLIENTGSAGLDYIDCYISSKDKHINLFELPKVDNQNNIAFTINKISPTQHIIKIPVLNKGESITFDFSGFSKKNIPKLELDINIRKKDLIVEQVKNITSESNANENGKNKAVIYPLLITALWVIVSNSELYKALYERILNYIKGSSIR